MIATITSTNAIVEMKDAIGRPFSARVWEGTTEGGVAFTAYIAIVQVATADDNAEFFRDLAESPRSGIATKRAIDLRLVI